VPEIDPHHAPRRLTTVPLLRRESIGESYHVLSFDMPEGTPARPGQFTMIRGGEWGDAPLLPRPMSYLSGGQTPSILVQVHGEGTVRMGRAEAGEPFALLGPLGNGWRPHDPSKRQLLVGGGVGVAPLIFLARELVAQGTKPILFYGGRTARDLPLAEDALELCEVEFSTEDGSRGIQGRVTDLFPRHLGPNTEVYTCGPNAMMAAVAEKCAARGVDCEVSLEAPMACGFGICLGCAIPTPGGNYLYACSEGPCVDARRIDWERLQGLLATASKGGAK
jgi:dihydroorotate dehydrogenase electron transfer subunit